MLKRSQTFFSSAFMLVLIFTIFVLKKGQSQTMQVQISNTPQFFYSHICQLTFTIISQNFTAFNPKGTQTFMITILQSKKDVRFLNYYVPPYICTNNSILIIQSIVDTCNRGNITSSFYCISIISSNLSYPQTKLRYNTTHFMYKFTMNNIICPSVSLGNGQDQYDIKFKIDVPVARDSTVIKMTGNYTYKFVELKYRIIEDIYINPTYNGTTVYQGNNFLIGGQSKLSFVMDIVNKTQVNSWQYFQIFFLQPIKNLSLITNSCLLTSTTLNPFQYPLKPYINQTPTQKPISCSLSILSNSLTFTNTNYTITSFVANQAFNLYEMYDYNFAGVRLNFSIDVNIYGPVTIQYYYVMRSMTSSYINDMGFQVAMNPRSVTMYENKQKPNIIYSVPLQTYQTIDSKYKAYFIKFNNHTTNSTNTTDSTDSNIIPMPNITISQFPFIITIFILFCTILMVLIRKQLYRYQKYIYIIFVLTDLLLKIILIVIIDTISTNNQQLSNIKQVSYLLRIFVIMQYVGFGIILFITYCTYLCYSRAYLNNKTKNNKQFPRHNIIFIVFTMLINYKLYCICLFNIKIGKQYKPKRYRNDQLYIKYCWHLAIQIIIILVQIFCICTNCTYLPISISFAVHQGILVILMGIVGKYVYSMFKWNKIKRNVMDICGNSKIKKIKQQQENKDRQLQEQINNQHNSKASQLNKSMNRQQKALSKLSHKGQPTSRPFITQIQPTNSCDDNH